MQNRNRSWLLGLSWTVTAVACGLAAAAIYHQRLASEHAAFPREAPPAAPQPIVMPQPSNLPPVQLAADGSASLADVTARVTPSVVSIATSSAREGNSRGGEGLGSGVIVDAEGLVVTNHHVIANARSIIVHLSDGRDFPARLIGSDSLSDLALLRLQSPDGRPVEVTPITFGDSNSMRQGDIVLAVGNPFGVGQTVTMGIVSATGRANMGIAEVEDFIQTDAAINPGNSGGALVSTRGELVGINAAILSRTGGNHGVGFAIPSNMVRPVIESLEHNGKVLRGWLGVEIATVDAAMARVRGLSEVRGVMINNVEGESPAARAGLRPADIVLGLDNEVINTPYQFRNLIAIRGPNRRIQMRVRRGSEDLQVTAELSEQPPPPPPVQDSQSGWGLPQGWGSSRPR